MRHQFTSPATVFTAVAGMLAVAPCSAASSTTGTGTGSAGTIHTLTVALVAEPASPDFTRADGAAIAQALLYNVYEPLVKPTNDGSVIPDLAASSKVSPDRTTYTFDLSAGSLPDAGLRVARPVRGGTSVTGSQ